MPAVGNIILADGQGTPANHTFAPSRELQDGTFVYEDRSGGIPLGYPRLFLQLRPPTGNDGSKRFYRSHVKVSLPVLEVTSPSTGSGIQPGPTLSYTDFFDGTFIIPERGSLAVRKDHRAYVKNLFAHAVMTSLLEDLESLY